jgi:hypothetical protein
MWETRLMLAMKRHAIVAAVGFVALRRLFVTRKREPRAWEG